MPMSVGADVCHRRWGRASGLLAVPAARLDAVGVRDDGRAPRATRLRSMEVLTNGVVNPRGPNRLRKRLRHSVGRENATAPLAPVGAECRWKRPVFVRSSSGLLPGRPALGCASLADARA